MPTLAHRAEYGALRAAQAWMSACSWERRVRVGAGLGRLWHRVDSRRRRVARDNVAGAFPTWEEHRVVSLVRANFEHLGATAAEFLALARTSREELLGRCRVVGREHLDEARARGRGVLILTGHLGNWELGGLATAALGYPFCAVGRRLANPLVDRAATQLRERFGGHVIPHREAVRPIFRALREGAVVAFLLDQRALRREAVTSRFFGRPVATNQGLALIALKTGAPVVPAFDRRAGAAHQVRFEPALELRAEGTREEIVAANTRIFDRTIEAAVRDLPEQWFWVHRRWRLPEGMGA